MCSTTLLFSRKLTTDEHTFHNTYTNPLPLYYPFNFRMRTIFSHGISYGTVPSLNITCTSCTNSYHIISYVSFYRLDSLRHPFISPALMPDGPPSLPPFSPRTAS